MTFKMKYLEANFVPIFCIHCTFRVGWIHTDEDKPRPYLCNECREKVKDTEFETT